jgi:hypothetical protein
MLTLTGPSDRLEEGRAILVESFADLRRLSAWRSAVAWGRGGIEFQPSTSESRWHVHAHVALVLIDGAEFPAGDLSASWSSLLARRDAFGRLDWASSVARSAAPAATFLSVGFLRDEAEADGVAAARRRAARRGRAGGAWAAMGTEFRALSAA